MEPEDPLNSRLVIVSNRLPIVLEKIDDQNWNVTPGAGGLVTAMAPVLKNRGGIWIGWPGAASENVKDFDIDRLLANERKNIGFKLKSVILTAEERKNFYKGFANEIIWPLFHDFIAHCKFNPQYWKAYQAVNRKFADIILKNIRENDFIWVHDYHLIDVARQLRQHKIANQIGFFLHIPFPPPDVFVRLPWREHILNALLDYDLIGFQTLRDRRNFQQCLRSFISGVRFSGKGQVTKMNLNQREIRVAAFPISIDFHEFAKSAGTKEVSEKAWYIHEDLSDRIIILGIDRLDYTKGIPERLKAFRNALKRYPDLIEKVTLVQVVVPSRRGIAKYENLKMEIEGLVGKINGEYTRSGWVPIHYIFRSLNQAELIAYYRTSEIALITPLKDGMNLVAKEYCASNLEENGVLILSEFAGVAAQFQKWAILVNPHDIEGMADAIYEATQIPHESRNYRMHQMRQKVLKYNIFWWVDSYLQAAIEKNLENFPLLEDYAPLANE